MQHKRKTNHERFEEDRNKLAIGYRLSAIGYRLILCVFGSIFAVTAFAAPYRASKDGSAVWDEATNLVWARCAVGQTWEKNTCAGEATKLTFQQMELLLEEIKFDIGGFKDWAVPTIRQLSTLRICSDGFVGSEIDLQDGALPVKKYCADASIRPTINANFFPGKSFNSFWGVSSFLSHKDYGWVVDFDLGAVHDVGFRKSGLNVRLVRASQLSGREAELTFPVRLAVMSKSDMARETEKIKIKIAQEERARHARKAQDRDRVANACNAFYQGKSIGFKPAGFSYLGSVLDAVVLGKGNGNVSIKIVDRHFTDLYGKTLEMSCTSDQLQ